MGERALICLELLLAIAAVPIIGLVNIVAIDP
jgi:hypothetical protein